MNGYSIKRYLKIVLTTLCLLFFVNIIDATENSNSFLLKKGSDKNLIASKLNVPTERINDIYQDNEGYIWIVTDSGIFRYDGYSTEEFINLSNTDESYTSLLHSMIEAQEGIFYVGTERGIIQLDKYTGQAELIKNKLINGINVSSLVKDNQGRIWIGSDKGLYMKYADSDEFTRLNLKIGEHSLSDITSLMLDNQDNLWITVWYKGLFRYNLDSGTFQGYTDNELERAYTLYQDNNQNIWVGTWGQGLIKIFAGQDSSTEKLAYKVFKHESDNPKSLLDDTIYKITQDKDGDLWIGNRSGLSILSLQEGKEIFRNYYPNNDDDSGHMPYNEVNCLLQTKDYAMFVGMTGGGIYKMNFKTGQDYKRLQSEGIREIYKTSSVHGLMCTSRNKLCMGILGYGPIFFDRNDNSFLTYKNMEAFKGFTNPNTVEDIIYAEDSTKIMFASYNSGLVVLDLNNKTTQVINSITKPALKDDRIQTICEDKDKNIWIGTMRGVYVMNTKKEIVSLTDFLSLDKANPLYKVLDITCDANNNIWCATNYDGIIKISEKDRSIKTYPNKSDEHTDSFLCICADSHGDIWAGSSRNGLFCYDSQTDSFIKIQELAFLNSSAIANLAEDHLGKVWVTTRSTVVSFEKDTDGNLNNINYWNISEDDNSEFFNTSSACDKAENVMYFGTSKGVLAFPCKTSRDENASKPKIAITSLRSKTSKLTLNPGESNFDIHFTLFNYNNKYNDIYKYRIYKEKSNPDEAHWMIVNGIQNFASFKNLKPGHYCFEVYGYHTINATTSDRAILKINIPQDPWKTWWAICLYILLSITLVVMGGFSIYSYWKLSKQKAIDKISKRKAEELNRAKLQFFTNISNDFMSPLNMILTCADNITAHSDQEKDLLKILSTNTIRLTRLVQQVLEFKTIDSDKHILKVSHHNLSKFISRCIDATIPILRKNDLTIIYQSDQDDLLGWFDPEKLDKIVYNLILNAKNYAQENSAITINLSLEGDDKAILSCTHQGKLMSPKTINKVFNKFYEHDSIELDKIESSIGLSVVKPMVLLHKGEIHADSIEGIGNRFTITLPISKTSYSDEEIEENAISLTEINLQMALNNKEPQAKQDYNILHVESDDEYCKLIDLVLSKRYNVTTCKSTEDAMKELSSHEFDIVVADTDISGNNGKELCQQIKNNIEYNHIPVIIISDNIDDNFKVECFDCGADGYLTKQTNYSVLIALISNFIKKREKQSDKFRKQMVLEVQDIEYTSMDKQFLQLAIDTVNQHLSDSDFGLTEFSQKMSMSRTILTDKLKRLTGLTPIAFILNARLTAAYKIATTETDNIRVSDLAYSLGFNDPKYFSKRFKIKYGVSPKTLMENKK